ncbi:MAG: hypothetical protein HDT37_00530 [Clostridiales bacterium]|nr:hypothetical protein [Clostridiales bacterium]
MKKKITFPDWTGPAGVTITRASKDKPRAVWGEYTEEPAEWLSLRATLEIAGGSVLFETFDSREEEEAARLEADRRAAWRNALAFAEQLWRAAPHHEYVVLFRPKNPNVGPEAVCICRRLFPYSAERKGRAS